MYQSFLKRFLEITVALSALPLLLLIFTVVAPIIFFTNKGPVFYNAYRMGKNGSRFKMYKFRTMKVNAPDLRNPDGSTYNAEDDPRLTPVGRFLRKTSIDELPQLINVLIGDMSFVGPRPTLYSDKYSSYNEQTKKRFSVRPGITGYTQAYFRNSIGQEEKFMHDIWYVENLSFLLDIKVIIKTVVSVIKRENIYVRES
jgi:undecaprenyl phosphate N,N'-diacetylbacillosamine 1-phosphate transferase